MLVAPFKPLAAEATFDSFLANLFFAERTDFERSVSHVAILAKSFGFVAKISSAGARCSRRFDLRFAAARRVNVAIEIATPLALIR